MKRFAVLTLAVLGTGGAAAQTTGRLFFDLAGNGGNQSAPHPGGLAMTNPTVSSGGTRLYLYWEFGRSEGQNILTLNYNVTTDAGVITEALNYQPIIDIVSQPRWQNVPGNPAPNPAIDPGGNSARFTAHNINQFGLKNDAAARVLDQGYDDGTNTTILGYVDVDAPDFTAVWITVDSLGISPLDQIYLGFGDEPLFPGIPDMRSRLPETFVPEPATLVLLALASLALVRPRSAVRGAPRA